MNDLLTYHIHRDRDGLAAALLPWLRTLARDCCRSVGLQPTRDWLDEAVGAASVTLVQQLGRLLDKEIESDRHLRNVLRRPLKKTIYKRLHKLHCVPQPLPSTRRARRLRGEPEYRPWEPSQRVTLYRAAHVVASRWKPTEPEPATRYWRLVAWIVQQARERAQGRIWLAVELILSAVWIGNRWRHLSIRQIAAQVDLPCQTLIDRLRKLGNEIIFHASPEIREEMYEFIRANRLRWA